LRPPNWPSLLAATVDEWRHRPFEYGSADCFQFVAEFVRAETGVDYRDRFPRYTSQLQAARILKRYDGVGGIITSVLGSSKPILLACRGDLVAGDFGAGMTAGGCLGVHCCSPGPLGLIFRPTTWATYAWSV